MKEGLRATILNLMAAGEIGGAVLYEEKAGTVSSFVLVTLIGETGASSLGRRMAHEGGASRIQEYRLTEEQLEEWLLFDGDRDFIHWITEGEILADDNGYLKAFQTRIRQFPAELNEKKRLIEFSRFTRYCQRAKADIQENRLLDAYENVLKSLHHWARLAIIEQGIYPRLHLWAQVRHINLGIYKLYEELTESPESLLKRVQLIMLACDFCISSKLLESSRSLLRLLDDDEGLLGLDEMEEKLGLSGIPVNLSLVINQLVKKALIREVVVPVDECLTVMNLKYGLAVQKPLNGHSIVER